MSNITPGTYEGVLNVNPGTPMRIRARVQFCPLCIVVEVKVCPICNKTGVIFQLEPTPLTIINGGKKP
jgi:hypothetical protein